MKALLEALLGVVLTVGEGFLVLARQIAIKWTLVLAIMASVLFAYNAARIVVEEFGSIAAGYIAGAAGTGVAGNALGWGYCLMPSSTGQAISVFFSVFASMTILNFYWQVLKLKGTAGV